MNKVGMTACVVVLLCGPAGSAAPGAEPSPVLAKLRGGMRIILSSVFVDDQSKALAFYTEVLGLR